MEAVDYSTEAWAGIRNGYAAGRLGHAYVIVGSPRGNGRTFAESILKLLFCMEEEKPCHRCAGCRLVDSHKHADILWVEPQSKSRQILADEVRALIQRMAQTAFAGGWKAGVVLSADCMNPSSENTLLKTLEEPPSKSLLLLVTDSPQSLLPTILSRCQKIVLPAAGKPSEEAGWREALMGILHELPPSSGLDAARLAGRFKGLFDTVKAVLAEEVETEMGRMAGEMDEEKLKKVVEARTNARLKEVQSDVFRVMADWHRDVLLLASRVEPGHLLFASDSAVLIGQAARHTQASALQAVEIVEGMARRQERNIPDQHIFDEAFRQLVRNG